MELYDRGRFFTVTGDRLDAMPAEVNGPDLPMAALHPKLLPSVAERNSHESRAPEPVSLDDAALLDKARGASTGSKFARLYDVGDWEGAGYPSQSEADLALCAILAFWTGAMPFAWIDCSGPPP